MNVRDRQTATKMGEGATRSGATTVPKRVHHATQAVAIERTFAWILRNRRMSRDYEFLVETTEALIYVAMIQLMVRRTTKGMA